MTTSTEYSVPRSQCAGGLRISQCGFLRKRGGPTTRPWKAGFACRSAPKEGGQMTHPLGRVVASATSLANKRSSAMSHDPRAPGCVTRFHNRVTRFNNRVTRFNNRVRMCHYSGWKCGIWLENENSRTKHAKTTHGAHTCEFPAAETCRPAHDIVED